MAGLTPRVVVVTRPTYYEELIARHATRQQAAFFLEIRGQDIAGVLSQHETFETARAGLAKAIPVRWRRAAVDRADFDRFLFEPGDIVVALGQDGLVANVAKYLQGQPVIGLNPDPERYDGVLVPHAPARAADLILRAEAGDIDTEQRTMVRAELDDGQSLIALNEIFVGHHTHQSARYTIRMGETTERHSSSGLIIATGTGSTGWARSISRERGKPLELPAPADPWLVFFVREAFPSTATQTDLTRGILDPGAAFEVISQMNDGGTIFGDGIERDRLDFAFGQRVTVRTADVRLNLVTA